MKKLAIIKNDLFKDYIKLVSTEDLESVLDNPDIPIPYECVQSIDNLNSDLLLEQLKQYFVASKLKNKDFFSLDENSSSQLNFMMNLIQLSSNGQSITPTNTSSLANEIKQPSVKEINNVKQVVEQSVVTSVDNHLNTTNTVLSVETVETNDTKPSFSKLADNVEIAEVEVYEETPSFNNTDSEDSNFEDSNIDSNLDVFIDDTTTSKNSQQEKIIIEDNNQLVHSNPFKKNPFKSSDKKTEQHSEIMPPERFDPTENVETTNSSTINTQVIEETNQQQQEAVTESTHLDNHDVEMIESLGIPKKSTIHFIKSDSITSILLDEKTVLFKGIEMSLTDAAKAAFKELNAVGMAVGLSNWLYQGKQLKTLKEELLNK